MLRSRVVLAFAFLALAAAPTAARGQAAATPQDVARAFFAAMAAERWREAASYVDTTAFDAYRREAVVQERGRSAFPEVSVEQLMRADSTMPRAAAEYQIRRLRESRAMLGNLVENEFAGVPNADSLARLSALEAAARWLEAQDERYVIRRSLEWLRTRGCRVPTAEGEEETIPRPDPRVVLGVVVRDSMAFVLHASAAPDRRAPHDTSSTGQWYLANMPAVLPLRLTGGRWRVLGGGGTFGGHGMVAVGGDCGRGGNR